jgi:hypothetical protein
MHSWKPTVWLVSDRGDWVERVRAVVLGRFPASAFVLHDWAGVSRAPRALPRLICWDVARWGRPYADVMRGYADRFYDYVWLVWMARSGSGDGFRDRAPVRLFIV